MSEAAAADPEVLRGGLDHHAAAAGGDPRAGRSRRPQGQQLFGQFVSRDGRQDADPGGHPALRAVRGRPPAGARGSASRLPGVVGEGSTVAGRRPARTGRRPDRRDGQQARPGGRPGAAPVVPGADAVLPVAAAAAEGDPDEPGLGARRLRRAGVRVPGRPLRRRCSASRRPATSRRSCRCSCSRRCSGCRWTTRCSCSRGSGRSTCAPATTPRPVGWGLEHTARIITSAAAIMVVVFGAFAFAELVPIKAMGFGLATAVFLDATLIRTILVPSTMRLMGDWNWWLPRWLDRVAAPRRPRGQHARQAQGAGADPRGRPRARRRRAPARRRGGRPSVRVGDDDGSERRQVLAEEPVRARPGPPGPGKSSPTGTSIPLPWTRLAEYGPPRPGALRRSPGPSRPCSRSG